MIPALLSSITSFPPKAAKTLLYMSLVRVLLHIYHQVLRMKMRDLRDLRLKVVGRTKGWLVIKGYVKRIYDGQGRCGSRSIGRSIT